MKSVPRHDRVGAFRLMEWLSVFGFIRPPAALVLPGSGRCCTPAETGPDESGRHWRRCALWGELGLVLLTGSQAITRCHAAGTVIAWGADDSAQCQIPLYLSPVVAVTGGGAHSLALQTDGAVAAWGFDLLGQATVPSNLTSAAAIAAGSTYSLALRTDGTVVVWGAQASAPEGLTDAAAAAAGWSHCLALKRNGSVIAWGSQTNVPEDLTNLVAIAAGTDFSLALRADSTVAAWGDDTYGQLEFPVGLSNVVAIAAGGGHCLAVRGDGAMLAWGRDDYGQAAVPPDLTNVVAISAGTLHSLALRADGTLAAWGNDTYSQVSGTPLRGGFIGIGAGGYHNLAIVGDGTPAIVLSPASHGATIGHDTTFRVTALGTSALSYQWQHAGTNLPGATSAALVLSNVQMSDTGIYSVLVTNDYGSVTSAPALLTAIPLPPLLVSAPQNTVVICGDAAVLAAGVDGSLPLFFQWQFEGAPIPGATLSSLVLSNAHPSQAGSYQVLITNAMGAVTTGTVLTVTVAPPQITGALTASGVQGVPFNFAVQALHSPNNFGALFLPAGLAINATNGTISGTPLENGVFSPLLFVDNGCSNDTKMLVLTIDSAVPSISSPPLASGTEDAPLNYQITATGVPTGFGADNLPDGLSVDRLGGQLSGSPSFAGEYDATIWASNTWGVGAAPLHLSITNAPITGLAIDNVAYSYSTPYLLDFTFSLRNNTDPAQGTAVFVQPRLLSANCIEDDQTNSPSETGASIARASSKLAKVYLVLDFTESIASLSNGDTNGDGISDAVDNLVQMAQVFVRQQAADTQIGVYEFHRDDMAPSNVVALTTRKTLLYQAIAGIWTNDVQGFPAGSRCWDALLAAIQSLGAPNPGEQHYVVFVSDGRDESSTATLQDVISAATNNAVKIFGVGFGAELDTNTLQAITSATQGHCYFAQSAQDLAAQFAQVSKDVKGQYTLLWATLKRSRTAFMPSFQISYQGLTATCPTNPVIEDTNNPIINTNSTPATTNFPYLTNFIIGYYTPSAHSGPVLVGLLRLAANAEVLPTGIDLRATYLPRYVRQLHLHYRANWPCVVSLQSTNVGEILEGWTLSQTNDGAGGQWLWVSSPAPQNPMAGLPFAGFGKLVTFAFQDVISPSNAFSVFEIDNTIYTNTGGQSFTLENTNAFLQVYPVLPHGTPVPWLIALGYTNASAWAQAELLDPDGDGAPNWQEYQANTDPLNPVSRFAIRNLVRLPDGRFQLTFSTALNRVYRVEASLDLTDWQTVQDNLPGSGQQMTFTDTRFLANPNTLFYRVVVY